MTTPLYQAATCPTTPSGKAQGASAWSSALPLGFARFAFSSSLKKKIQVALRRSPDMAVGLVAWGGSCTPGVNTWTPNGNAWLLPLRPASTRTRRGFSHWVIGSLVASEIWREHLGHPKSSAPGIDNDTLSKVFEHVKGSARRRWIEAVAGRRLCVSQRFYGCLSTRPPKLVLCFLVFFSLFYQG